MNTLDPGTPTPISQVPTAPLPAPTGKLNPGWSIQVFPYKRESGKIVSWNSVIRHEAPGTGRPEIKVLSALASPQLAQENAENFLRARGVLN